MRLFVKFQFSLSSEDFATCGALILFSSMKFHMHIHILPIWKSFSAMATDKWLFTGVNPYVIFKERLNKPLLVNLIENITELMHTFSRKVLGQWGQLKGRSPVWMRSCSISVCFIENFLGQNWHEKDTLAKCCALVWISSLRLVWNSLPHVLQGNVSPWFLNREKKKY